VPAQAPAPAPEANEQPAPLNVDPPKAPVTPDPAEGVVVEYQPTGDTGLDLALRFVGNLGFGPDTPEIKAATTGDFGPMEAKLKTMGDKAKGYEQYLKVAKESQQRNVAARKAKDDSTLAAVVSAVGSVAQWNAVHAWVQAEADAGQKAEINAALQSGPLAASAMARQLAEMFKLSGKSTQVPKAVAKDDAGATSQVAGSLTPSAFKDEVRKLEAKFGHRLMDTPEYAAIKARRLAYRN
jgi:hypothetical protein